MGNATGSDGIRWTQASQDADASSSPTAATALERQSRAIRASSGLRGPRLRALIKSQIERPGRPG